MIVFYVSMSLVPYYAAADVATGRIDFSDGSLGVPAGDKRYVGWDNLLREAALGGQSAYRSTWIVPNTYDGD